MRVLAALSGGVDSSVAAAELIAAGHEVTAITMRLWGGESETGCCSVADVDDARRVAQQLGIDHLVFNFTEDFERHVVTPYVEAHVAGSTPNPCIECNRHLKFDRLLERAEVLGFDAVATGHHARIVEHAGVRRVARGADLDKDQSYVVHMLDQEALARTMFPIGHLTKSEVRTHASRLGLRTADKPDSQDVCFVADDRATFLAGRMTMHEATVVDLDGARLGTTDAVELVTVGQRRGLGLPGGGPVRYVVDVDVASAVVRVGDASQLLRHGLVVSDVVWSSVPVEGSVRIQVSAHGPTRPARIEIIADTVEVLWDERQRVVAPGQSVVFYDVDDAVVLGGGIAGLSRPEGAGRVR